MILLAMFDSSVLDVGAKFTSWQVSDEVSRVLKKSGITGQGCTKITSDIDDFLLKKVDEFISEINCRRAGREKFICFPVKKTSHCAKQGFAVTFSWIYKSIIVIHFWFENGFLYNSALVGIRLIVGSESGTTPSPFKPTTDRVLLLDFLTVPRGTRPNSDDSYVKEHVYPESKKEQNHIDHRALTGPAKVSCIVKRSEYQYMNCLNQCCVVYESLQWV